MTKGMHGRGAQKISMYESLKERPSEMPRLARSLPKTGGWTNWYQPDDVADVENIRLLSKNRQTEAENLVRNANSIRTQGLGRRWFGWLPFCWEINPSNVINSAKPGTDYISAIVQLWNGSGRHQVNHSHGPSWIDRRSWQGVGLGTWFLRTSRHVSSCVVDIMW